MQDPRAQLLLTRAFLNLAVASLQAEADRLTERDQILNRAADDLNTHMENPVTLETALDVLNQELQHISGKRDLSVALLRHLKESQDRLNRESVDKYTMNAALGRIMTTLGRSGMSPDAAAEVYLFLTEMG